MSDLTPPNNIDLHSAQGAVIGEHNTIYQFFADPRHARVASRHISFSAYINDKAKGFVGRQFVFDALDEFIQGHPSGYFLVQGVPGIGKTAVLAHLVRTRGYPHHFNIVLQNIRLARQFLANACAQLIARYELPHATLPEDATTDSSFLLQCLEEAAADHANRPVVLLLDALDEADLPSLPPRVNALFLPPSLPEGAYVVVTSRSLDNLPLQVSELRTLFLEQASDSNMLDIRTYVQNSLAADERLREHMAGWGITETDFVAALTSKSEGNFIYLRYVLAAIAEGRFQRGTVSELPQGLRAYYRGHWEQMKVAEPEEFMQTYALMIGYLAVVREPVSIDQLQLWTDQPTYRIRQALSRWREFLEVSGEKDDLRYRIYHTSFQEFLGQMVDLPTFDDRIADYYLRALRGS